MADVHERGGWGSRFLPQDAEDQDEAVGVDEVVAGVLLLLLLLAGEVPAAVVDVEDRYAVLVHQKKSRLGQGDANECERKDGAKKSARGVSYPLEIEEIGGGMGELL